MPQTYTCTYDDDGSIIYKNRPSGNLIGELPLGAGITQYQDKGDPFNPARGITTTERTFTIRRDDDTTEEDEETRRGEVLARALGLRKKANGRYTVEGGDKTALGLFRTVQSILKGEWK